MNVVIVPDTLWACSMLPEGIVERWLVADGERVVTDQPLASVRVEDALHEVTAPTAGWVSIVAVENAIIEPGSVLGVVRS